MHIATYITDHLLLKYMFRKLAYRSSSSVRLSLHFIITAKTLLYEHIDYTVVACISLYTISTRSLVGALNHADYQRISYVCVTPLYDRCHC
jgi:hypothetical protein